MPPPFLAPVARTLGVKDATRAAHFYSSHLGFTITHPAGGPCQAVSGPVQLTLAPEGQQPGHWDQPLAPGAAALFLETTDLADWRSHLLAQGLAPSSPARLNRVKMTVFTLADLDGNTLWFGESYDEPGCTTPPDLLEKALPHLPVPDVPAALAYYRDVLGFGVNYEQDDLAVMDRGPVTLLLIERPAATATVSFYVHDADALYQEFRGRHAELLSEPVSRPWGLREFTLRDLAGNELTFCQPFE